MKGMKIKMGNQRPSLVASLLCQSMDCLSQESSRNSTVYIFSKPCFFAFLMSFSIYFSLFLSLFITKATEVSFFPFERSLLSLERTVPPEVEIRVSIYYAFIW
jgi:hypothetical protein